MMSEEDYMLGSDAALLRVISEALNMMNDTDTDPGHPISAAEKASVRMAVAKWALDLFDKLEEQNEAKA
jgi:hypothetical protein